jgi:peptidoglycan/xylan/chitin deacetylase (PgdA/CDA1 family)
MFTWPNGAQCAVSLTYDDSLPVHYELVGPLLERHGLRGTFYTPGRGDLVQHPDHWRALAEAGHELGNHSLFHPCRMTERIFSWLDPCYNLCDYTPTRLRDELAVANSILHLVDGQSERTYGHTCCDVTIGRGDEEQDMSALLADLFLAGRGSQTDNAAQPGPDLNLMNVGCISVDGRSLPELIAVAEQAQASGGWAVLVMHGIGAETHKYYLDATVHEQFITWLTAQHSAVWTAPFRDIAQYVRQERLPATS